MGEPVDSHDVRDVTSTLALTDTSTARLLAVVDALSDDECRAPSRLPGWSRGHVVTHLARNADGLGNLLTWASTGVVTPMYASPEAREGDVEAGADRPAPTLAADLRDASARLRDLATSLDAAAWSTVLEWRAGARRPASDVPAARLTEVVLHGDDLDAGLGLEAAPDPTSAAVLDEALARLRRLGEVPAFVVHAEGDDTPRAPVGATAQDGPVLVGGSRAALVAWLTGRSDGAGLHAGGPIPRLPTWG